MPLALSLVLHSQSLVVVSVVVEAYLDSGSAIIVDYEPKLIGRLRQLFSPIPWLGVAAGSHSECCLLPLFCLLPVCGSFSWVASLIARR